jgi:hypothetical protein
MEKTLIERICGVNWRTTLTGIGTALGGTLAGLAGAMYALGDIALIISPEWKAKLFLIGMAMERGCQVLNSMMQKDRAVSGTEGTGFVVSRQTNNPDNTVRYIPPDSPETGTPGAASSDQKTPNPTNPG